MIPVLVMLLLSILTPSIETSTLENEDQTQATSGRQGPLDVDCSGYTFEDLFESMTSPSSTLISMKTGQPVPWMRKHG